MITTKYRSWAKDPSNKSRKQRYLRDLIRFLETQPGCAQEAWIVSSSEFQSMQDCGLERAASLDLEALEFITSYLNLRSSTDARAFSLLNQYLQAPVGHSLQFSLQCFEHNIIQNLLLAEYDRCQGLSSAFFSFELSFILLASLLSKRSKRALRKVPIWASVAEYLERMIFECNFMDQPFIYWLQIVQLVFKSTGLRHRDCASFMDKITPRLIELRLLCSSSKQLQRLNTVILSMLHEILTQTSDAELVAHLSRRFGIHDEHDVRSMMNQEANAMSSHFASLKVKCWKCGKIEGAKKFSKCSRCKIAYYCSRACQKKDWKSHKPNCVKS